MLILEHLNPSSKLLASLLLIGSKDSWWPYTLLVPTLTIFYFAGCSLSTGLSAFIHLLVPFYKLISPFMVLWKPLRRVVDAGVPLKDAFRAFRCLAITSFMLKWLFWCFLCLTTTPTRLDDSWDYLKTSWNVNHQNFVLYQLSIMYTSWPGSGEKIRKGSKSECLKETKQAKSEQKEESRFISSQKLHRDDWRGRKRS